MDLQAVRGQMQGKVDALASRVGTMNAHMIRLDALGRRITDLADLDRGEFDFDKPPPAGGPEGNEMSARFRRRRRSSRPCSTRSRRSCRTASGS